VPLGSKATHDPIGISKSPWARQEQMKPCHNETKTHRVIRFEETEVGVVRLVGVVGVVGVAPTISMRNVLLPSLKTSLPEYTTVK